MLHRQSPSTVKRQLMLETTSDAAEHQWQFFCFSIAIVLHSSWICAVRDGKRVQCIIDAYFHSLLLPLSLFVYTSSPFQRFIALLYLFLAGLYANLVDLDKLNYYQSLPHPSELNDSPSNLRVALAGMTGGKPRAPRY